MSILVPEKEPKLKNVLDSSSARFKPLLDEVEASLVSVLNVIK
jgi:hypothetical protein